MSPAAYLIGEHCRKANNSLCSIRKRMMIDDAMVFISRIRKLEDSVGELWVSLAELQHDMRVNEYLLAIDTLTKLSAKVCHTKMMMFAALYN